MVLKNNYLGFDIGTDSVGWAVSDSEYKILRYKGNMMWGVNLFDAASQAAERRGFRTARRRLNRKKQRLSILKDFFCDEISKVDEKFFDRLLESSLMPEDCENRKYNIFFDDKDYTDKEYNKQYPTIHHLICELMDNPEPHDVRLVYLACAYILGHRGHFLSEVDKDKISDVLEFKPLADEFFEYFTSLETDAPFEQNDDVFSEILKMKKGVSVKEAEFKTRFFNGKKISQPEEYPVEISVLVKFICGGTIALSKLFMNESYEELENNKVTVSSADFSDKLETLANDLEESDTQLLLIVKKLHDWSLLVDILNGESEISKAKKKVYETHQKDLADLKMLCRKYLSKNDNNEIFRLQNDKPNYVKYTKNIKSAITPKKPEKYSSCNQEDFCKFVKGYISKITPDENDTEIYNRVMEKLETNTLCPKQVTSDNRVIPYQLYYYELKKILDNASRYLDFLNVADEYGTVRDKILQTMLFKIPYYVGPLVSSDKSEFAWFERKAEGKITPWNFEEKVDLDKSEDKFIYNMTAKCSYLVEEDVLPKNSLLYCEYTVLNEINNLKINGEEIPVVAKQSIYEKLFKEKRKVSVKMIKDLLKIENYFDDKKDNLSGIDTTIKSSLKSYHDFKRLLNAGVLNESDVESIIVRLTVSTDKPRIKKWIKENYPQIPKEDVNYIAGLNYNDYGRLSEKLLTGIFETDKKTGETTGENIITKMYNTNMNLMQILADDMGYKHVIDAINKEYYSVHPKKLDEKLKAMYIPNAVRRSVLRTLDVAKELKKVLKEPPAKIFIEMARGEGETKKGSRTKPRREKLKEQFRNAKSFVSAEEIKALENRLEGLSDSELRSEKYYLYFNQFGRSMYSGKPINFEELGVSKLYDIDHIYPQSKVKDDSIDNKVLCLSEENGFKKDNYPVPDTFRKEMSAFWKNLFDKEIISEKKYNRLTRATRFTNDELSGFINRQLVETRHSTKAVAQLLGEIFPESEIVYVKAGLASEFRHEYELLKCREINDLHHAKDAYLNIVMGNVHDVKYTKNPMNIINRGEQYSLKLKSLLGHNIERNGVKAWHPETSFKTVREMMSKNSIRYVKYSYVKKGGYFDQMPLSAKDGLVPMKNGRLTSKYGGYANPTASHFALVNVKNIGNVFIPVEVISMKNYISDVEFARKYAYDMLSVILSEKLFASVCESDISFPLNKRIIKLKTMLEADGFRFNLCSKSDKGKYITISSAVPVVMDRKYEDYAKRISSFNEKRRTMKLEVSESDKITKEENLELYDLYTKKCFTKPFCLWKTFEGAGKTLENGRDKFMSLSVDEQVTALMSVTSILKTGRSTACDLSAVGGVKMACVSKFNAIINNNKDFSSIRIVDQSPTGLIEKYSDNLITEV